MNTTNTITTALENQIILNNKVYLVGEVDSLPKYSHELFGEGFYEFNIKVARLSNQIDIIPLTVSERLMNEANLEIGKRIALNGQFRSYNKIIDEKSKLMLTVFVREFCGNNIIGPGYSC